MNSKSTYKTKQREELIGYMEKHRGVHVTVQEICDYFHRKGNSIGMTTVYRQLERMVDEGLVNKYIIDANTPACFEYIADDKDHEEHGHDTCFHCKCESCGKLIHLHCDEMEKIKSHLLESHEFTLDPKRTVFYGLCKECAKAV